jgi:ribosomal protein S18 acetylase RimI-like enzyme
MSVTRDFTSRIVRFRAARLSDAAGLEYVERYCYPPCYRETLFSGRQFIYYLRRETTIARVAVVDSGLIGYVLGVIRTGRQRHVARLHGIAVLPKQRRRGISRQFMRMFLRAARARRCRVVVLDVAEENRPACSFFTSFGFRRAQTRPDFYGPGINGTRMRLEF